MDPKLTRMNETKIIVKKDYEYACSTVPQMEATLTKMKLWLVVNQCNSNQNLQNVNSETLSLILRNVKAKENESLKQQWCENNQVDDSDFCEIIEAPQQQSQNLPDVKTLTEILHNVSSSSMQNAKEIESIWKNAMREAKSGDQEIIDLVSDEESFDEDPGVPGKVKTCNKLHQNVSSIQNVTAVTEIPRENVTEMSIIDLNSDDENIESDTESLEEDDDPGVPGEIKCEHCETMFMTKNKLKSHVNDMIDPELIFECNKTSCPFETNLICAWHRHFHSHVKLLCDFCEVAFASKTELDGHKKSQHEIQNNQEEKNDHKCESCSQEFKSLESKESHTCRGYHQCNYCESMFLSRQDVNIHMKNEHAKANSRPNSHFDFNKVRCDLCDAIFDSNNLSNAHAQLYVHKKAGHKCEFCNEIYKSVKGKENHMKSAHSFKCPICDLYFVSKKLCTDHMKNEHDHIPAKKGKRKSYETEEVETKQMSIPDLQDCQNPTEVIKPIVKGKENHLKICTNQTLNCDPLPQNVIPVSASNDKEAEDIEVINTDKDVNSQEVNENVDSSNVTITIASENQTEEVETKQKSIPEIPDLQDCQNPTKVIKPKVHKMKLNLSFAKKIAENKYLQSSHTSETDEEFDL